MEKVQWKVEGMTCANCALTVHKYLEKKGAQNIAVSAINGDVTFDINGAANPDNLAKGVQTLGYQVSGVHTPAETKRPWLSTHYQRFLFCLPFAVLLNAHMLALLWPALHQNPVFHLLMNPWAQLGLTIPPFLAGMRYFGRSAVKSLRNGVPNMNVLISIGATSAFVYSLIGLALGRPDAIFFETAATIITLVFLGEHLEHVSVQSTQRALKALVKSQKVMANMIAFDDQHQEHIFPIENTQLKVGDLVLINSGEQVPADCKILWGDVTVNEAILTGESEPVARGKKDPLIGGSVLESGTTKAMVTAVGNDTVLARILQMVKQAQGEKPPMQQLADRISAVFVPAVLLIALVAFAANWIVLQDLTSALMRAIAVLVIACPCAMGLATPAAIAVGLGRGARNGVLFRNAKSLELFQSIRQVVFDKTGTLTTGRFRVAGFESTLPEEDFKQLVYSLEKHSAHPLAKSIAAEWKTGGELRWKKIEETRGQGMKATDAEGNIFTAGSYATASALTQDESHNIYITRNGVLIGSIDLEDELRPEAAGVVQYFKTHGIRTVLLSGDRRHKAEAVARQLGIDEVIAEKSPEEKLQLVSALSAAQPTVMVGDGINDAPALAKATIGVSMSEATQLAVQSAQVVLMNGGLHKLPLALGLGKHTQRTIRQNLFWAFAYNIVAIPVAALGFLTPSFGALVMGLSDVVLAANSVRLSFKKVV
ncbi:heavy metal translocating P-type ATPase [Flaviaesturariibacter aridisoli]|uniref:Cadmium-translocating P-type ATPase n=1 Tax=Flaviaesturariibacter aridisoli TaxID=2545761 RepID=A0A4V6P694_9BACT|nr:cation-translocating P-type ATPase [Flaviaesturariibacter aridisoli]TCZ74822.1 cadmium-translocating P-type ATPase [Flaviaesturariibacter aridisoli]